MKKLRVLLLIRSGLEPPESLEGVEQEKYRSAEWKCEYDVAAALRQLGHEVRVLGVYDDLGVLRRAIEEYQPHIAFNLLEEWSSVSLYDQNVVSYLELRDLPYTGCNPRGLMLARDKAVSKKLLAYHRIHVPDFAVFPVSRRKRRPKRLRFPLLVKSVSEDASLGVSRASLVRDDAALIERVRFVHEHTGTDAIAEEFIEGRELYVGVLGNSRLRIFPVWELIFANQPEDVPLIATARAKWSPAYQKKWGVTSRAARELPAGTPEQIVRLAKRICQILFLSGYARIDFRLAADGKLYFLEANPNPQLAREEDFAESAEEAELGYEALVQRILNLGLSYRPVKMV